MKATQTASRSSKTAAAVVARANPKRTPKAPKIDPAVEEKLQAMSLRRMRFFLFSALLDAPTARSTRLITKDLWRADIETVRDFVRQHLMHYVEESMTQRGRDEE